MSKIVRIGKDVLGAVVGVAILAAIVMGATLYGIQHHGFWFGMSLLAMLLVMALSGPLLEAAHRRGLGWLRWPFLLVVALWGFWSLSVLRGWSWAAIWDHGLGLPTWDPRFFDDPNVRAYLGLTLSFLALYVVGAGSLWRMLTIFAAFGLWLFSFYHLAVVVRDNEAERCAREHRLAGIAVPRVVGAASQACWG